MTIAPATFEDFIKAAANGNVVPVVRTLNHSCPPVAVYEALASDSSYSFLFESAEGNERVARHSFVGAGPRTIVRGSGDSTIVESGTDRTKINLPLPEFLSEYFENKKLAAQLNLPPLAGGAVGYLGFQATARFEPAFSRQSNQTGDDAVLMFFETVVVIDRVANLTYIISVVFAGEAEGDLHKLDKFYRRALQRISRIEAVLKQCPPIDEVAESAGLQTTPTFSSNWDRQSFEAAVDEVKERIRAGDCYQVVLSQCFQRKTTAPALAIYRALRQTNPSPFMFFMRLDKQTIVGASPEMLVRCAGDELQYRPIAGTRPRGDTLEQDEQLTEELRQDEKEIAEHMMLVDLGRNDLGKIAAYGSVKVEELMTVERYSHVQHLVTRLSARLRDGADRFSALASCFPAGTVTGAPKVRAMQIIQELEPTPRGIYSGAILYADYAGNLDSCIAIRTLILDENSVAFVQAGAGVVADSIAAREYDETVSKARALFRAVEMAEAIADSKLETANSGY